MLHTSTRLLTYHHPLDEHSVSAKLYRKTTNVCSHCGTILFQVRAPFPSTIQQKSLGSTQVPASTPDYAPLRDHLVRLTESIQVGFAVCSLCLPKNGAHYPFAGACLYSPDPVLTCFPHG